MFREVASQVICSQSVSTFQGAFCSATQYPYVVIIILTHSINMHQFMQPLGNGNKNAGIWITHHPLITHGSCPRSCIQIPMALCGVGRWEPMGAVPEGRFCKLQDKYQVFQQTHKRWVHLMGNRGKDWGGWAHILEHAQVRYFRKDSQKTMCLLWTQVH